MDRLLLWDVDGTLLTTDGISGQMMRAAMREVIGEVPDMPRSAYAGKTDWQIIQESFPHLSSAAVGELLARFSATYVALMEAQRAALVARSQLMAGVREVLAALDGRAAQAPLTGNIAPVARLKLEVVDLLGYFDLAVGAYGDDHYDRVRLVEFASQRSTQRYGRSFSGAALVVVGDTPNDIRCGRANGARTVAVATGAYSLAELHEHQPDALLADLSDTQAAVAAIMGW
jgi:phosphoglycolate phosphatase